MRHLLLASQLWLVVGLFGACSRPSCNGMPGLCSRTVSEVVWPGTHNSHASQALGYTALANQHVDIPTQLRDGIRALNIDLYVEEGALLACHLFCSSVSQPAEQVFGQLTGFLSTHPDEVLLLVVNASDADDAIAAAMASEGLSRFAVVQDPTEPWPTLAALIEADERLIVLVSEGGDPTWLQSVEAHVTRTEYGYNAPEDFDCALRFESEGSLFQMSHHLYDPTASPELATTANTEEVLTRRMELCEAEVARPPNIVFVDYYDLGDLFLVTDALNQSR